MSADATTASLSIALATAFGIITQSTARKLQFPGIVLLLGVGLALGTGGIGLIVPSALGAALNQLVGFAVAVILFEGGMNLRLRELRESGRVIRRLVTLGAIVTLVGGTLAARLLMGWNWRLSILFGSLVIVTGPTVVTPLVRRFRLQPSVATVLEAEGVLIDAVGAVTAVVALEIALEPSGIGVVKGVASIATRIGFGVLAGLLGGLFLRVILRFRGLVAEGLENVFTLAVVWALYYSAHAFMHESGIAAVTVAGILVGNLKHPTRRRLLEFNDQLTVMLIGMLFVLLAADVRVGDVLSLGVGGVGVVVALVIVVRPACVFLSTQGSSLRLRERAFVAWMGPRGIIAAAVASLFANELADAGLPGGEELRALVFLTILLTVTLAGVTGGFASRVLHVSQPPRGWLLLGANPLACAVAHALRDAGVDTLCLDSSVDRCHAARETGVEVLCGNAMDEELLHTAGVERRAGVAAITPNDEVNLLFIQRAREEGNVPLGLVALTSTNIGATPAMVHTAGGKLLFLGEEDVERWSDRLRSGDATLETIEAAESATLAGLPGPVPLLVPLVHQRDDAARPFAEDVTLATGDRVTFALDAARAGEARAWLGAHGWAIA